MLFEKQSTRIGRVKIMHPVVFLPLFIAIIIIISNLGPKGSIVILENPDGSGFTMDFREWSTKSRCKLFLNKGDVLQVETIRDDGEIALMINGKNGSEPYMGNDLKSGIFTVAVSETDTYYIQITGKNATGKVVIKNLKSIDE